MKNQYLNALISNGSFLSIYSKKPLYDSLVEKFDNVIINKKIVNDSLEFILIGNRIIQEQGDLKMIYKKEYNNLNNISDKDILNLEKAEGDPLVFSDETTYTFVYFNNRVMKGSIDYWGVNTLYYYSNDNLFLLSDNIFLINEIVKESLSQEAIYECLFFNYPLLSNTFFNNIFCLLPGQTISFDITQFSYTISAETDYSGLLDLRNSEHKSDFTSFSNYFDKLKKSNNKNYLSLSSGSDSRTVLAGLLNSEIKFIPYTFGKSNYIEQKNVKSLLKKLNLDLKFFNLDEAEERFDKSYINATYITNGLINPFRVHYYNFSSQIEPGSNIFAGFFGSEFIKGEIALDAMISLPHYDVIRGTTIEESIANRLPELSATYRKDLIDYIQHKHKDILQNVNTDEGYYNIAKFLLQFEPSKVFAPIIALNQYFGQHVYLPFLNRNIIKSTFESGYGVIHTSSLRSDFIGLIKCITPQSLMIKPFSSLIFKSRLDRQFSFSDVLEKNPDFILKKRKVLNYSDRIYSILSNSFLGQIDNVNIDKKIIEHVKNINEKESPIHASNSSGNKILNKHIYNLFEIAKL